MPESVLKLLRRCDGGELWTKGVEVWVGGGVEAIEGVVPGCCVGRGGLLVNAGQLPGDEPEHVAEQRVEGSDGVEVGEAGGPQDGVDGLELLEDGPYREPSLGEDP